MAIAEELQIVIDAKVTQAVKNLKNVQKGLGDTGKASNKMGDIFKKLAGPLALGAVVLGAIRLGKEFSKAASDAEEIGSKYATIFRDIRGDAEEVANTFAESFGLAGSTARELLGNTADLLTGLGFTQQGALELSEQVNTLAADLASFSNFAGGTTGASEALTKALLGEAESAKALGIVINQNTREYKDAIKFYTEVEGKTLLQAKAFTALQFATEQSGNAIGDVARTFESHANVSRRLEESTKLLKEELGEAINEGLTPMLVITDKIVKSIAIWVQKNNDINNFFADWKDGAIDTDVEMETLNDALLLSEARLNQATAAGRGHTEGLQAEVEALKVAIAQRARGAALDAQFADAKASHDKDKAEALVLEISNNKAKEEADKRLLELQFDALTAEAQQIQLLDEEIIRYATLRSQGAEVQELLNELVRQRNELLEDEINTLGELTTAQDFMFDNGMVKAELFTEVIEEQAEVVKELKATWEDYANGVLGFLTAIGDLQSANSAAELQALEESGASQEELDAKKRAIAHDQAIRKKKLGLLSVGVDTAAAIIRMLADPGGVAGVILSALAGGTGLAQAAAINAVPIPSLATGGSYITDGPELTNGYVIGDNTSGQERHTIEPLGGSSDNTGQIMILRIGDRDLKAVVQGWINNRGLHSSRGGAI